MRIHHSRLMFACLTLAVVPFAAALPAPARAEGAKATPWRITGELEEACSCNAACPCWFESKPTRMNCSGGQFLFIKSGSYGNVTLDGVAFGAQVQSPDGTSMMDSFGKWNFMNVYIDEKATPEQRKALQEIVTQVFGPAAPPEKITVRFVPVNRKVAGQEHSVTFGTYGSFSGHLVDGGLGGIVKIVNPPAADPVHKEYEQGRTTKLVYQDAGQNWAFSDTNYMHAIFNVNNEDFEKFAAAMAQKMKAKP